MTLNCVIIDDEPLALDLLKSYVEKTPQLKLVGSFNNAADAIKVIKENQVELVFLDIQMPQISGLEFASILPVKTKVIFTTAFKDYAVDGYKVNALDYLLKPYTYEDFLKAVNKAEDWFNANHRAEIFKTDRYIFVKSDYKLVQVKFDDILFIEGLKDYVRIYVDNERHTIMSLMNMKRIEECLPYPEFMRTHRSYIVHMNKIKMVDRFRLVIGENFIPISESYKESIQNYLDEHTLC